MSDRTCSTADLSPEDFEQDTLLRRIPSLGGKPFYAVNTQTGEERLSSACFKLHTAETSLSFYSQKIVTQRQLSYADVCRKPHNAVASIPGDDPPRRGLRTEPDPWPADAPEPNHPRNAAHAVVNGIAELTLKRQKQLARDWAELATLVHP